MRKLLRLAILGSILCCIYLLSVTGCADYHRPKNEIIREIAYTYHWHPQTSSERIEILLEELEKASHKDCTKLRKILDYWRAVDNDLEIHEAVLPDGLDDSESLCIVVLGYQLNPDGSIREELVGRLNTALSCAEKYPNAYILCTGGGTASKNKSASEAEMMGAWLIEHGLDSDRLLLENKSLTTSENAIFSCELIQKEHPEIKSIAIVSSDYHIPCGAILFQTKCIEADLDINVVSNAAYRTDHPAQQAMRNYVITGILNILNVPGWR